MSRPGPLTRALRSALVRYVRREPDPDQLAGAERRVFVVLMTAYGMGGTIRTIMNAIGHLTSAGYEVTVISVARGRDEPFFTDLPESVEIVTLEDRRPGKERGLLHPIRWILRNRRSVLMHPEDRPYKKGFNLWVDWRLVKALRGKAGFLITTRPGLNLIAIDLAPPGLVLIGQEHMHLREHSEGLQDAMKRRYGKLALLMVLTRRDRRRYRDYLGKHPKVAAVPNTIRDLGDTHADLSSKTVLTAGRYARQKGYDRLIKAWEIVVADHPDWRLRVCGEGPQRPRLERMLERRALEGSVTLAPPAESLGDEMAKASIFVMSSRWEGLPLVLLEAMSAGMAIVSFATPTGPADVIEDGVNGLLARPRTIAALAEGLGRMMDDAAMRQKCSAGALETARDYSMETVGPRWEELLRQAWAKRAGRNRTPATPTRQSG